MTGLRRNTKTCVSQRNETKTCVICGRSFGWRRKWADCWSEVRYCSSSCRRRRRLTRTDLALEDAIIRLLGQKKPAATICPSEAARDVEPDDAGWRALMDRTRDAARRLVAKGTLDIVQRGRVVDPSEARGAIRLRRRDTRKPG